MSAIKRDLNYGIVTGTKKLLKLQENIIEIMKPHERYSS